jgi:glutathione S-transferase
VITLVNALRCPYCVRVRLVLAEKGVEHRVDEIDLADKPASLRRLNPRNRVPVLVQEDAVIPESAVVNEYLEEVFDDPPMLPSDPAGRAAVRRLIVAFEDFSGAYYAFRRSPDAWPDMAEQLDRLEATLDGGDFLAGAYSLADPAYWPWFPRLERWLGADLSGYPRLAAWRQRLEARTAYAAELDVMPER